MQYLKQAVLDAVRESVIPGARFSVEFNGLLDAVVLGSTVGAAAQVRLYLRAKLSAKVFAELLAKGPFIFAAML